jgi:hypothetical protein
MLAAGSVGSNQLAAGSVISNALASTLGVWSRSGAEIYYAGGNVGIGTNNPATALDVVGNFRVANANGQFTYDGFAPNAAGGAVLGSLTAAGTNWPQLRFARAAGGSYMDLGQNAAGDFKIEGNDIERFTVRNSGQVGIGTATPNFPLSFPNSGGEKISLYGQDTNSIHGIGIGGGRMEFYVPSTGHRFDFGVGNNANFSPKMSIYGDGSVGIGSTLSVGATNTSSELVLYTAPGNYGISHADGTRSLTTFVDASGGWVGTYSPHPLHFYVGNGFQAMTLNTNENVGIGTTTPSTKLQVVGEITCTAVNITSDRNAKENFAPINAREVLAKVARLPISEWQYREQPGTRHIGPMAQDFRAAFEVGRDEKHITSVDADGVALAAIQGLHELVREKETELGRLKSENQSLAERLAALERAVGLKSGENK